MKVASVQLHGATQVTPADFIHGKDYVHETGEVVNFNDMSWCISPVRGKQTTAYFSDLPKWLMRPAKLAIAHGWLIEGRSNSWLLTRLSDFKRLAKWLENFEGTSMVELTDEHMILLQKRLTSELTRYYDTLEDASVKIGRRLSFRESRKVCRESGLLGPKGVSNFVSTFNFTSGLVEEIDGLVITVRLKQPRAMNYIDADSGIGSADPNKVLKPEQIAELERALLSDLQRYEKARGLIDKILGNVDFGIIAQNKPDTVLDLERYFGINGFREHTGPELAELIGISPSGYMNIARRIKKFLAKKIGAELADEVMKLREQLGRRRAKKRFEENRIAREKILSILATADLSFRDPRAFCIERYFGLHGQRLHSSSAIAKQLGLTTPRSVYHHVREGLCRLIGERNGKRLLAVRERLLYYLTRAIKAQALRLQLGVARRISAVLEIPVKPKMKVQMVEARRIVEIQFRAGKTWGDEGFQEWVPCVDKFGEIAEDAIRTTQILTKDLRELAAEEIRGQLFIIPDNSFETAIPLSTKVLQEYIYTNQKGKDTGILRRYALEGLFNFEFHHIRQTHSTHMIEEGGTIQDVAHYLGHTTYNGSTNMAGVFYLAGGTEAMRRQTAEALRRGAATGLQFDGVARLKIEAMGEEAKKVPVPPNQLSIEQAQQRVRTADIIDEVPVDAAEAVRLMDKKIVFNITRYGGCLLQACGGHCPTANPCPIGIISNGDVPKLGCGCKYLVLLPHSVEQLSQDLEVMEAQLTKMSGEQWAGWRPHTEAKIAHWRALLGIAVPLEKLMEENQ